MSMRVASKYSILSDGAAHSPYLDDPCIQRLASYTVMFANDWATPYRKPRVDSSRDVTAPAERPRASQADSRPMLQGFCDARLSGRRRGRLRTARRPLRPALRFLHRNVRKRVGHPLPQTASRYLKGRHGAGRKTD